MKTERTAPDFKRSLDYHHYQDENRPPECSITNASPSNSYSKDDFVYKHNYQHQHQRHSSSASIDASSSHSSIFERDYGHQQEQQQQQHHRQQQQRHQQSVVGSRVLRDININNQQLNPSSSSTPSSLSTCNHQFFPNAGKENNSNSNTKPKVVYHNSTVDSPMNQADLSGKRSSQATDFKPLSSERLRPIRQKTRNAVVSILEDETVALEFLQKRNGGDYVVEVLLISGDGIKVTQFHPNGRQGIELSDTPPTLQSSTAVSYAFSALPTKLWKKYQYAEKFVRLVKMKTPKV